MPLIRIITIGLSFHFRTMNNMVKKIRSAIQLSDKKSISDLLLPYNANKIIVDAAEMINPNEADFKPFSTSNAYADF